jgi:hypothetical protein
MRAREILDEDYNSSLESDLNNLLIAAKGSGAQAVQTQQLASQLQNMGYSIDANSILPLLQRNASVLNATPTQVTLKTANTVATGGGDTQDNAAKVGDMAQKANSL